jgi:cell division septum initiation protein DivIVA
VPALHARGLGFFADLKKKVNEELSKNEELKKSLAQLREHDTVKNARDAAKRAQEALKGAKARAGEIASDAKAKVRSFACVARRGRRLASPGWGCFTERASRRWKLTRPPAPAPMARTVLPRAVGAHRRRRRLVRVWLRRSR